MKTEWERKYKVSTKHQPAFISKGFTNWKDATMAFNKYLKSDCHKGVSEHRLETENKEIYYNTEQKAKRRQAAGKHVTVHLPCD